jgi:hypothetical protein
MFWLDFNIPLDDEFEIEKQVRYLQASTDIEELRHIAVALVRFSMQQAHLSNQIVTQMAEIEADMIHAGHIAEPTAEHQRMAAEILAAHRASS